MEFINEITAVGVVALVIKESFSTIRRTINQRNGNGMSYVTKDLFQEMKSAFVHRLDKIDSNINEINKKLDQYGDRIAKVEAKK